MDSELNKVERKIALIAIQQINQNLLPGLEERKEKSLKKLKQRKIPSASQLFFLGENIPIQPSL